MQTSGPQGGSAASSTQNSRRRVLRFYYRPTGEIREVDALEARISRLRRRARAWGQAHPGRGVSHILVTLTYRPGVRWGPRHISAFMTRCRKHLGKRLLGYLWVAELQQRGAVHYHVVLAVQPGSRIPKPDVAGWWPHGMSRVERSRDRSRVVAYARKYLQKANHTLGQNPGKFPKGLRLFAVVWRKLVPVATHTLRVLSLPDWLRKLIGQIAPGAYPKRAPGGGWLYHGILYQSGWVWAGLGYV